MAYQFPPFKNRLKEIEEWLQREFSGLRAGRVTPLVLDRVKVEVYGDHLALKQLASINVEDARTIRLAPWDKTQIKAIESALTAANLGAAIVPNGPALKLIFPELTTEKRQMLIKIVRQKVEEARVSLRQERDKVWHDIQMQETAGKLSEDEKFRHKNELQKLVDETNQKLEAGAKRKEAEINN